MAVALTYLSHSGFLLESGGQAIVIDPFLSGNPKAVHKPEDLKCQYLALTHGHADHFGDTLAIAKANAATVVAAFEICEYCGSQGIEKVDPANPGGKVNTDFGWVAFTQAFHSSSYNGQYMGMSCGLVVHIGGVSIYHCGDTALFSDMKLIGEIYRPQIACIPVGDRFTMGPELGAKAAELIKPEVAIPIHYGTFPFLSGDVGAFTPAGVEVRIMTPGQSWQYG